MAVYAKAHTCTFTKGNIRAAFAKTEILLTNPSIITVKMMAPSLKTSMTSLLLLRLASPICKIVDLISHHKAQKRKCQETDSEETEWPQSEQGAAGSWGPPPYTPMWHGLASLVTTSASFLVSSSPILSSATLPCLFTRIITPPAQ